MRGDERLICEAKGRTSEKGIDADIAYGQLLRRMTSQEPHTRYALVVPSASVKAVERVPAHVRKLLRIVAGRGATKLAAAGGGGAAFLSLSTLGLMVLDHIAPTC